MRHVPLKDFWLCALPWGFPYGPFLALLDRVVPRSQLSFQLLWRQTWPELAQAQQQAFAIKPPRMLAKNANNAIQLGRQQSPAPNAIAATPAYGQNTE